MVKIKVSLAEPFSEAAGTTTCELELREGRVEELVCDMLSRFPGLRGNLATKASSGMTLYALLVSGGRILDLSSTLEDGQEVRILPQLSGG